MIPQSNLTVVAPIAPGREASLRSLLVGMNFQPGLVDPRNSILPFSRFDELHFARLFILDDQTTADMEVYGQTPPIYPLSLAFLADFDGCYDDFVNPAHCGCRFWFTADLFPLRRIRRTDGYTSLDEGSGAPAGRGIVNWIGRTVRQCRQEARLRSALVDYLANAPEVAGRPAVELHAKLRQFAQSNGIMPEPEPKTPAGWWLRNKLHAIFMVPILLLGLTLWGPVLLLALRSHEKSDPVIAPPPDPALAKKLADIEDHGSTNQFSAMGSIKPGLFRRRTAVLLLAVINYTTRHVYKQGPARTRAYNPLRPMGLHRQQATHAVREQLRRQPRELHGRLHQ